MHTRTVWVCFLMCDLTGVQNSVFSRPWIYFVILFTGCVKLPFIFRFVQILYHLCCLHGKKRWNVILIVFDIWNSEECIFLLSKKKKKSRESVHELCTFWSRVVSDLNCVLLFFILILYLKTILMENNWSFNTYVDVLFKRDRCSVLVFAYWIVENCPWTYLLSFQIEYVWG